MHFDMVALSVCQDSKQNANQLHYSADFKVVENGMASCVGTAVN